MNHASFRTPPSFADRSGEEDSDKTISEKNKFTCKLVSLKSFVTITMLNYLQVSSDRMLSLNVRVILKLN